MNKHFQDIVLKATGASGMTSQELIQTLWSGYGEIVKVGLAGADPDTVVLKYIVLPAEANTDHPRGWNSKRSHARKIKSYDVEMHWYRDWSARCGELCRVPSCYATISDQHEHAIILEDLDEAGFPVRKTSLDKHGTKLCLAWLANFHATFLSEPPVGLWQTGTYWHLATRPDELASMEEGDLKQAAELIDQMLNECKYQTLVHGDAKVANFCFSRDGRHVAAVDFQYVGGGCGMKDVAYFLGSCLTEQECEKWEVELLEFYFEQLRSALGSMGKQTDWEALKAEWQDLFPVAWTDFSRFVQGWMPNHWKINAYTRRLATSVLSRE